MVKNSFQDAVLGGGCRIKDESKKCMKGSGERRGFHGGGRSVGAPFPQYWALLLLKPESVLCMVHTPNHCSAQ